MNAFQIVLIIILILIVIYFLMVMPRIRYNKKMKAMSNVLYAHRGLHDNEGQAPENSMAAFRKAVEAGYGIELDVQLTKDGIPVVFHDFKLDRVCAQPGKVVDYTFQELQEFNLCSSQEKIPKFSDFLKLVDGRVPLIVELKIEWKNLNVCQKADELLRAYKGKYCIESFNPLGLLWYRKNHKDVLRGQLADNYLSEGSFTGVLYFALQSLLLNFLTKPDFIAYNHHYSRAVGRRVCRNIFRNTAVAWTIKSKEELATARKSFDIFIFDSFVPQEQKKEEKIS